METWPLLLPWILPTAFILVVSLVLLLVIAAAIDDDNGISTGFFFTLCLFGWLHVTHTFNLLWLFQHPLVSLGILLGYMFLGIPWVVAKWKLRLLDWREHQEEGAQREMERAKRNNYTFVPQTVEAPKVRDHKRQLLVWGAYWPLSLIWSVINGPIRRWWTYVIFSVIGPYLQQASNKEAETLKRNLDELARKTNPPAATGSSAGEGVG